MDRDTEEDTSRTASRRKVLASSAAGATLFGYSGVVGTASAVERGTQPTPEELERVLSQSEHIGFKPGTRKQVNRDTISSVDQLDASVTAGPDHPDIYYGQFRNARPPSGEYYHLSDDGSGSGQTAPISVRDSDVRSHLLDFLSVKEKIGCQSVLGHDLCVTVAAGFDLAVQTKSGPKVGGELFFDITFSVGLFSVTISPSGFGVFFFGRGDKDGWCAKLKAAAPGPLPGKLEAAPCATLRFIKEGDEYGVKVTFPSFKICVEEGICVDIATVAPAIRTPLFGLDDLPEI